MKIAWEHRSILEEENKNVSDGYSLVSNAREGICSLSIRDEQDRPYTDGHI